MTYPDQDDRRRYQVIVNRKRQYSMWFADREPPPGWSSVGKVGSQAKCREYLDAMWANGRRMLAVTSRGRS